MSILETARMPWHDVRFLKDSVIYVLKAPIGSHDDCWTGRSRYRPAFYGEVEWSKDQKGNCNRFTSIQMIRHRDFQYRDNPRYDWLALPHNVSMSPNEAVVRAHTFTWHIFCQHLRAHIQVIPIANTGTRSDSTSDKGSTWRMVKKSILVMPQLRSGRARFKWFAACLTGVMVS